MSVKNALEQMKRARSGEQRTEQYQVKAQPKIVEEVSEEEWQRIRDSRREGFVVSTDDGYLGYDDSGKEIWDVNDPARRATRAEEASMATRTGRQGASKLSRDGGVKEKEIQAQHGDKLMKAFGAGARAPGSTGLVSKTISAPDDLDNMLAEMCGDLEAMGDATTSVINAPAVSTDTSGRATKRKHSTVTDAVASKKQLTEQSQPVASAAHSLTAASSVPARGQPQSEQQEQQLTTPSVAFFTGPALTAEMEVDQHDDVPQVPTQGEVPQSMPESEMRVQGNNVDSQDLKEAPVDSQDLKEAAAPEVSQEADGTEAMVTDPAMETTTAPSPGTNFQVVEEKDKSLWFFFVDAFEDDRSGRVFFFGKVKASEVGTSRISYQNCCLVVEGIEKCLHLVLDADPDDHEACIAAANAAEIEFQSICKAQSPGFRKLRAKLKLRNYAFEKKLPNGDGLLPFLKVVYDAAGGAAPSQASGRSFSHTFGAQTSLLERLITSRRIMGPSWLRLQPGLWTEPSARLSFCALEFRCTPNSIFTPKTEQDRSWLSEQGMPTSSPPLRVLSVSMQTHQRSGQHGQEPLAIACTFHPGISPDVADSERELKVGMQTWMGVRRIDTRPLPRESDTLLPQKGIQHFNTEVALFHKFLQKIQEYDPDVIAGYNAYGFDLDVLASRMSTLRVGFWQKLGRLRRPKDRMPRMEGRQVGGFWVGNNITAGRLVCDVLLQAKDLLPKLGSYDLPNLAKQQLKCDDLKDIEPEHMLNFYENARMLVQFAERTRVNAYSIARLAHSLQILPLTKQLTNLAGNLWNASLQNKRAERNEFLLCHEFHRKKFVLPDKESALLRKRRQQLEAGDAGGNGGFDDADGGGEQAPAATGPKRGKAQYTGGLVLEPKAGLYDDFVMMLDFNSLYPSIIQEYNICFTTVERPNESEVPHCNGEAELLALTKIPDGTETEGTLPQVLRRLVESRKTVKSSMKSERDPKRLQALEIRQKAIKLTANSMYGTLGFQNSRFYAKPLACLITAKGREALQNTINVVEKELCLEVVYGDTDSVFVNSKTSDYDQAMQVAQQIKRSVNKRYKRLEIEVDGIFGRLLLLKKKKYAALKIVDWKKRIFEKELKGLDVVRRDWCGLARKLGEEVLGQVLECREGKEAAVHWIHNYLTEKAAEMDAGSVPVESFVITKGLTKAPKDYPDAKHQPHVQVALREIARGKSVLAGQEVAYVICQSTGEEGPKASFAERARHPLELQQDSSLKIDLAWYKSQQIHPVISRLLVCVEGTDAARLAECLGMDSTRFAKHSAIAAYESTSAISDYASMASTDVAALLDRDKRWKGTSTQLAGVMCPTCTKQVTWEKLLRPDVDSEAKEIAADQFFRCGECAAEINPRVAQNQLVMQIRKLLKEHCEGWVQCGEELGGTNMRTRRLKHGKNEVPERYVFQELEYMEHLCEAAIACIAEGDSRSCGDAIKGMQRTSKRLLECNGNNWIDCGQLFSSIFGAS